MFGILDDELDGLEGFDRQTLELGLRSLLQNRRQAQAIALRDYSEQLEQDEFLHEYPQAGALFERVATIENQAYINAMRF